MLRSLGTRYACLSVPFWDVFSERAAQEDGTYDCRSYGACSPIVHDLGGTAEDAGEDDWTYRRAANNVRELGWVHDGPPMQGYYDADGKKGFVRFDVLVERIPPEASREAVLDLFATSENSTLAFWRKLQFGTHDRVHDTIGGFMRSRASPVDPVFIPWHATVDLLGYLWELCHDNDDDDADDYETELLMAEDLDGRCLYTNNAKQFYGNFSFDHEWYMNESNIDGGSIWIGDIYDDPLIGHFFSNSNASNLWRLQDRANKTTTIMGDGPSRTLRHGYIYNNDALPMLQRMLKSNSDACPTSLRNFIQVDDTIRKHNQNLTAPTYSDAELVTIQQGWMERAIGHWSAALEDGNDNAVETKKRHAECVLRNMDHDTLERWAIDDAFVSEIVMNERSVFSSSCKHLLTNKPEAEYGNLSLISLDSVALVASPSLRPSLVPSTSKHPSSSSAPTSTKSEESVSRNTGSVPAATMPHQIVIACIVSIWIILSAKWH